VRQDSRHRSDDQKRPDIGLAGLRNPSKALLSPRGVLPWHKAEPGCEVAAASELTHLRGKGFDRQRRQRTDARHRLQPARRICFIRKRLEPLGFRGDLLGGLRDLRQQLLAFRDGHLDFSPFRAGLAA
jgi:hypothetical protein